MTLSRRFDAEKPGRTSGRHHDRPGAMRAVIAAGLIAVLGAMSGGLQAQQPFDVALREGLLSIRANNASLLELTDAISDETGVRFVITGDGDQTVSADILDEPVDRAVTQLTPNYMVVRDGSGEDAEVIEVVLMLDDAGSSGSSGNEGGFLPSGAPAEGVVADDQLMDPQVQGQQLQANESVTEEAMDEGEQVGFDANGQPIGADGLPIQPEGMPLEQQEAGDLQAQ